MDTFIQVSWPNLAHLISFRVSTYFDPGIDHMVRISYQVILFARQPYPRMPPLLPILAVRLLTASARCAHTRKMTRREWRIPG